MTAGTFCDLALSVLQLTGIVHLATRPQHIPFSSCHAPPSTYSVCCLCSTEAGTELTGMCANNTNLKKIE